MASGETDLDTLLASMSPHLMDGEYIFCSMPGAAYGDNTELEPIASFIETEGLTLVVPRDKAEKFGITFDAAFRGITLKIHSSLEAVGLTAAFSKKLTEHGISANVIAGFYHDHIFVQSGMADAAMKALGDFSEKQQG